MLFEYQRKIKTTNISLNLHFNVLTFALFTFSVPPSKHLFVYYIKICSSITAVKGFMILAPGWHTLCINPIKTIHQNQTPWILIILWYNIRCNDIWYNDIRCHDTWYNNIRWNESWYNDLTYHNTRHNNMRCNDN
jgi:hypothetical protein